MNVIASNYERLLEKKAERANSMMKWAAVCAGAVVVLTLIFIAVELVILHKRVDDSLVEIRKTAAENHARTQQYIKCIILIPESQRTEANFDKCTQKGQIDPNTGIFIPAAPSAAVMPQQTIIAPPAQQTTSGGAPPKPNNTTSTSTQPAITQLINDEASRTVDRIEQAIKNIEKGL